jgi:probable rRNA maturation factor
MSVPSNIFFHFLTKEFSLKNRTSLKSFISLLLEKEGRKVGTINYIFCTDDYLLELNKSYLKHFTLTDIITFELSAPNEPVLSDIYISINRVKENAKTFQIPFKKELHRVIFHGALHLSGYKDKKTSEKKLMREKENFYLDSYFVSRDTVS